MKGKFILGVLFLYSLYSPAKAQSTDYRIYGRISTVENKFLTGYITWEKDKMYWIDFFSASKLNNPYAPYFGANRGILFHNNNYVSNVPSYHIFTCRFGNIKKIRLSGYNKIELQVKDGHTIELKKGTNDDIGKNISIYDNNYGNITLKWDKISEIEFMEADSTNRPASDIPIAGIVKTHQGIYKGIVTWDKDERTNESCIEGRTQNEYASVPFKNISKIEKKNNSSVVTMINGNSTEFWGSNDVNNQNRGIIVNMPGIGRVDMYWNSFEIFETIPLNDIKLLSYNDFRTPLRLYGEVQTRKGEKVTGILVYDLDEAMDFEILEGKNDDIAYAIPFKYIKSIEPKNYKYSFITLKNGSTLSLGDSRDVNEENDGILVFTTENIPTYIPWKEVQKITLE